MALSASIVCLISLNSLLIQPSNDMSELPGIGCDYPYCYGHCNAICSGHEVLHHLYQWQ